jgi:hypothetical protein
MLALLLCPHPLLTSHDTKPPFTGGRWHRKAPRTTTVTTYARPTERVRQPCRRIALRTERSVIDDKPS